MRLSVRPKSEGALNFGIRNWTEFGLRTKLATWQYAGAALGGRR